MTSLREEIARASYAGYVDIRGYPNDLPTWDELPEETPANRTINGPLCKRTWRDIAEFTERAVLAVLRKRVGDTATLERVGSALHKKHVETLAHASSSNYLGPTYKDPRRVEAALKAFLEIQDD